MSKALGGAGRLQRRAAAVFCGCGLYKPGCRELQMRSQHALPTAPLTLNVRQYTCLACNTAPDDMHEVLSPAVWLVVWCMPWPLMPAHRLSMMDPGHLDRYAVFCSFIFHMGFAACSRDLRSQHSSVLCSFQGHWPSLLRSCLPSCAYVPACRRSYHLECAVRQQPLASAHSLTPWADASQLLCDDMSEHSLHSFLGLPTLLLAQCP